MTGVTGITREPNALVDLELTTVNSTFAAKILDSASTAKIDVEAVTLKLDSSFQLLTGVHGTHILLSSVLLLTLQLSQLRQLTNSQELVSAAWIQPYERIDHHYLMDLLTAKTYLFR